MIGRFAIAFLLSTTTLLAQDNRNPNPNPNPAQQARPAGAMRSLTTGATS